MFVLKMNIGNYEIHMKKIEIKCVRIEMFYICSAVSFASIIALPIEPIFMVDYYNVYLSLESW
jgi:hypothetical protein